MASTRFGPVQYICASSPPELRLVDVSVSNIRPQDASKLMSELAVKSPLGKLSHLKRIKKRISEGLQELSIILHVWGDEQEADDVLGGLPQEVQEVVEKYELQPYTVKVAGEMPTSRELWKSWSMYWPITWRPPEPGLRCDEPQLSDSFQKRLEKYMLRVMQETQKHEVVNAALVVDPAIDEVIAIAIDQSHQNPLRHAAMEVISETARHHQECSQAELHDSQLVGKRRKIRESDDVSNHEQIVSDSTLMSSSCRSSSDAVLLDRQYLCTGLELYLVREPCVMCAMALVHSRFQKIIYSTKDETWGALGSKLSLHGTKGLNHKFQVYYLPLLK